MRYQPLDQPAPQVLNRLDVGGARYKSCELITNVYVDAFNLYYGCLKDTPYKWLDLGRLCRLLLPGYTIKRIRYFTAIVESRP